MTLHGLMALACLLALAVPTLAQEDLPAPPDSITHVVVITLDGVRPDALQQAEDGNLVALAESGAVDWAAQTVSPTMTLPAHTSILTGLDVAEHGVEHDDLLSPCPPIDTPTFLTLAADAGYTAAMVVGKEKFCIYDQDEAVGYYPVLLNDADVAEQTVALLEEGVEVVFAHFPSPDVVGHLTGWMGQPYLNTVTETDAQVGVVLDTLDAEGLTDETLVIVTADHGGHFLIHSEGTPEDATVPWIIAGPGVVAGTELNDVTVTRTAPTVLWALGLPLPPDAVTPVIEAFGFEPADAANDS